MRLWRWLGVLALAALAACSSLPIAPRQQPSVRAVDYVNDDVANLLIAFDLPAGIEPIPDASTLSIDVVTTGSGGRHIRTRLAEANADDLAGSLPPPADGRTYYLFGFSDRDRAGLHDLQAWARALPSGSRQIATSLAPALCTSGSVDLSTVRVTVLAALTGVPKLAPLIADQPLAALFPAPQLPACTGHSG